MPVPSIIADLSTTASINSPQGTDSAKGTIDDYLRAHAAFIAQNRDAIAAWDGGGISPATLAASGGAGLVGASDGRTVQENLLAPVSTDNAKLSKSGAIFTEYHNTTTGNGDIKASVGMHGNPEANLCINMDYTDGVHRYYDASRAAMWLALGPDNFAMQRAETGVASGDIWTGTGSKYLFGGDYLGRFFINSYLGDNVGTAQLYIRRNADEPSIGGDGDLVLEGSRIKGTSAPVLLNAYNTGDVFLATGGGQVSIRTLNATNECEIATTGADGSSGLHGVVISDGEASRMGLNFGVNTASGYAWIQASKTGVGLRDIRMQPSGGDVYFGGAIYPLVDNSKPVGAASFRWSVIYAGTGTINTSDATEKQQIAALSAAEKAVALAIKAGIKRFKFNDAVAAKGTAARIHVGVIAQEVAQAFVAQGLDPARYALFCSDTWTDDAGVQHTRLGIRYDELLAFVIAAL